MIKTHTMLCIVLISIGTILMTINPIASMLFNLLVLLSLYILLLIHSKKIEAVGPVKSTDVHIINALVMHIKSTDTENLYKGSPLEELVIEHLKQN